MDEQNYVVILTSRNKNGSLITRSTFLHTSSKLNEEKPFDKKKYKHHPRE